MVSEKRSCCLDVKETFLMSESGLSAIDDVDARSRGSCQATALKVIDDVVVAVAGRHLADAHRLVVGNHHLTEVVDVFLRDAHRVEEVVLELVAKSGSTISLYDIDTILETDPYLYSVLLTQRDLVEQRHEELSENILNYQKHAIELEHILETFLTDGEVTIECDPM